MGDERVMVILVEDEGVGFPLLEDDGVVVPLVEYELEGIHLVEDEGFVLYGIIVVKILIRYSGLRTIPQSIN